MKLLEQWKKNNPLAKFVEVVPATLQPVITYQIGEWRYNYWAVRVVGHVVLVRLINRLHGHGEEWLDARLTTDSTWRNILNVVPGNIEDHKHVMLSNICKALELDINPDIAVAHETAEIQEKLTAYLDLRPEEDTFTIFPGGFYKDTAEELEVMVDAAYSEFIEAWKK